MQNSETYPNQNPDFPTPFFEETPQQTAGASIDLGLQYSFRFQGTASEYFGIWIVNILLTIITLGLYAPWAKVRRLRYFYGNTWFIQRRFDFTGLPSKILIGRIIALVIYGAISLAMKYSVELLLAGLLLIFLAVPWLVRSTIRFRARNSKFGNSRFFFAGSNKSAYWCFLKCVAVTVFTLGLFFPAAVWLYKRECLNHLYIGQLNFKLNADWPAYMRAMYMPVFIFMAAMAVLAAVLGLMYSMGGGLGVKYYTGLFLLAYLIGYLFVWPLMMARIFITSWNSTSINRSRFTAGCSQWRYAWIILSNWLAKIISLGLLTPWAAIRLYKYQTESLKLVLADNPDDLMNQLQQDHNAVAEELSEIFDLDISL